MNYKGNTTVKSVFFRFLSPALLWIAMVGGIQNYLGDWQRYWIFEHSDGHLYTKQAIELANPTRFLALEKCGHIYDPGYPLFLAGILNLIGQGDYQHRGLKENIELIKQFKYPLVIAQSYVFATIAFVCFFNFIFLLLRRSYLATYACYLSSLGILLGHTLYKPDYLAIVEQHVGNYHAVHRFTTVGLFFNYDLFLISCYLVSFSALFFALKREHLKSQSTFWLFISGFFTAYGAITRQSSFITLFAVIAFFVVAFSYLQGSRGKKIASFGTGLGIPLSFFLFYNTHCYGAFWKTGRWMWERVWNPKTTRTDIIGVRYDKFFENVNYLFGEYTLSHFVLPGATAVAALLWLRQLKKGGVQPWSFHFVVLFFGTQSILYALLYYCRSNHAGYRYFQQVFILLPFFYGYLIWLISLKFRRPKDKNLP